MDASHRFSLHIIKIPSLFSSTALRARYQAHQANAQGKGKAADTSAEQARKRTDVASRGQEHRRPNIKRAFRLQQLAGFTGERGRGDKKQNLVSVFIQNSSPQRQQEEQRSSNARACAKGSVFWFCERRKELSVVVRGRVCRLPLTGKSPARVASRRSHLDDDAPPCFLRFDADINKHGESPSSPRNSWQKKNVESREGSSSIFCRNPQLLRVPII